MEQKILSSEPRRSFSNEFKLQMVKLASQPGVTVARIAREHDINDNRLFKWLRLWQNERRISWRLPVTTSSGAGVDISQRGAAYVSEINRLKALVAKLQGMQFGKSSEKLRAKNRTADTGSTGANQRTSGRNGGNAG